jgi:DNA-binding CsgD family transcriptional regulator
MAADSAGLASGRMWALRATAEFALARGDAERAAEAALESLQAATGTHPLEAERSRIVAGRALAARGHHAAAIAQLRQARGALLVCGAERLADLATRELRRLGEHVSRSRPGRDMLPGLASLSQRELEVARLVADRLTNRQIAQQLIISEKTVERHLAHIFEKLGVDSRVTVARMVEGAAAHGAVTVFAPPRGP